VSEGLTPAILADELGIQRSGISHLLSGRNNPGFDFIQKLLTRFPKLNAEWFILGKGNMYKQIEHNRLSDLFAPSPPPVEKPSSPLPPVFPIAAVLNNRVTPAEDASVENDKVAQPNQRKELSPTGERKTIEQLVVLYTDKTFSVYSPAGDHV